MEMYLQFGYGMMSMTRDLIDDWGEANVILSPRDLTDEQIVRFSSNNHKGLKECLIDPQFYLPRADYPRLTEHEYWPNEYQTSYLYDGIEENLIKLRKLNDSANTTKYILPSIVCKAVDNVWVKNNDQILELSNDIFDSKPSLASLPLKSEIIRNEKAVEQIINLAENWEVDGFYVVAEPPNNGYLVEDPLWHANLLNLLAGLKLLNKEVILGYASHQFLSASLINIDGLASGNWLNVRSFPLDKFNEQEKEPRQRALWYYCPHSFSEYKIQFIDTAYNAGLINLLKPKAKYMNKYISPLFSGVMPSGTDYSESNSHRHYLTTLKNQIDDLKFSGFQDTYKKYEELLNSYKVNNNKLASEGIFGQDRDFKDIFDANLSAIISLKRNRGFVLEREL